MLTVQRPVSLTLVLWAAMEACGVALDDLPRKTRGPVMAKNIYAVLARRYTHASYPEIAAQIRTGHSTIINAEKRAKACSDADYLEAVNRAIAIIERNRP